MSATRLLSFPQVAIFLSFSAFTSLYSLSAEQAAPHHYTISIQVQAPPEIMPPSLQDVRTDRQACGNSRAPQSVLMDAQRNLKNVVVWLDGAQVKAWKARNSNEEKNEVIYEEHCEFSPRIVVVPPDGSVSLYNRDNVLHGLRTKGQSNTPTNRVHPPNLNEVKLKFSKPEIVPIACDFHPWMKAFVVIAPHAHYEVTNASGAATFKDVVPGTYQVKLWHEILGQQTLPDNVVVSNRSMSLKIPLQLSQPENKK
jgi:plastocyanin